MGRDPVVGQPPSGRCWTDSSPALLVADCRSTVDEVCGVWPSAASLLILRRTFSRFMFEPIATPSRVTFMPHSGHSSYIYYANLLASRLIIDRVVYASWTESFCKRVHLIPGIVHEIKNKSERNIAKCTRSGANDAKTVPKIAQKCALVKSHVGLSFGYYV